MASIGGLDLGFGSQTQIVRTNVLAVSMAAGVTNKTGAEYVHNKVKESFKGSMLEPDFTLYYETAQPTRSGYTEAIADSIFDQDTDNSGTANSTALENHGLLRDIRQVPLLPGSAHCDATAANVAFGSAHTLADVGDISGNMMLQGVLSVGGIILSDGSGTTTAGLFQDTVADSPTVAPETGGIFAGQIQAEAMDDQYENMMAAASTAQNKGGLSTAGTTGISTGARKGPFTLNLLETLTQFEVILASGAATADISTAHTNSLTMEEIANDITGDACIISVLSIAKIC